MPLAEELGSFEPLVALVAAFVGAVIASLAAWFNTRRTLMGDQQLARAARDETRRQAITDRTSAFLAASYHGVWSLRDLALADVAEKQQVEKTEVWPPVDRVNSALVAVQINDPEDVVLAVEAIDQAMVVLAREAKELVFTLKNGEHAETNLWRNSRRWPSMPRALTLCNFRTGTPSSVSAAGAQR